MSACAAQAHVSVTYVVEIAHAGHGHEGAQEGIHDDLLAAVHLRDLDALMSDAAPSLMHLYAVFLFL